MFQGCKKRIKVDFRPIYGRRGDGGAGRKFFSLVTVGAPAEYMDVYIWSEHMRRHSIQSEHIHIHRPYVHYFRSFVSLAFFIKLLTGLFQLGLNITM